MLGTFVAVREIVRTWGGLTGRGVGLTLPPYLNRQLFVEGGRSARPWVSRHTIEELLMAGTVHTLKVTLRDMSPPVWRLVEVPSEMTLGDLSHVLVQAMGWDGYHLHVFTADGTAYWPPHRDDDLFGNYRRE